MAALRYTTALAICASVYIVLAVVFRQLVPSEAQGHTDLNYALWNGPISALHNDAIGAPHAHKVGHVNYASQTSSTPSEGASNQPRLISTDTVSAEPESNTNTIYLFNVHAIMFLALPIITYSLDCQCFIFQLYCDLQPRIRSALTIGKVAGLSMILAGIMYFLVGTFGYLSFGERTRGNILQNYKPTEDYLMAVGYSLYSIPVVMAYALTIFPLRDAIFNYLYGVSAAEQGTVIPPFTFILWSVTLSTATLVFGILTPGIVVIIGLLGALCSSTLCFILPAWYRIQMNRRGLLPFGCKDFADPAESLPQTDVARQQGEVQRIIQQVEGGSSPTKGYGSIIENGHSSNDAELAAIQNGSILVHKEITIPLHPLVDATLAYGMLALGVTSAILGTTAAFLNIVVGIGE